MDTKEMREGLEANWDYCRKPVEEDHPAIRKLEEERERARELLEADREKERQRARAYARWLGIYNREQRRAFKRSFKKRGRGYTKSQKSGRKSK